MGHYRSEMYSDREHDEERSREEEKIKRFEKKLDLMIEQKGISRVLAEMVAQARPGDGLCGWLGY